MKAIKLDVETRKASFIEVNKDNLKKHYEAIGGGCNMVQIGHCTGLPENHAVFVDEEGLFNDHKGGVVLRGAFSPYVGNCVIVGGNDEGGSEDVAITLEQAEALVNAWMDEAQIKRYQGAF